MYLGMLSSQYESNGDPGCVSHTEGDAGGASYGAYQFATNAGVPSAFVRWLQNNGLPFGDRLANAGEPGSWGFDQEWEAIGNENTDEFFKVQHDYVQEKYYLPAVENAAAANVDLNQRSFALQNVVWSASVQYGPYWVKDLFNEAAALLGQPNASYCSDAQLIPAMYEVRASDDWTSGSPSLRPGLRNRFENECNDALAMLG
jgi:hypothetical protein